MTETFHRVGSDLLQDDQKAIAEPTHDSCNKLRIFTDTDIPPDKINFFKNEPAIINAKAGSTWQEKDVLIKDFTVIPPHPPMKNNQRLEAAWINNSYSYRGNNLIGW